MPRGVLDIIPHANGNASAANGGGGEGQGLGMVTGTHSACASCKHQRKKCAEDCILAPVFPAEKTREFQAVHKVFGVSNVIKMMRRVEARDRERVAESLVWEANSRENDPILGAMRQYQRLQEEKKQLEKELGGLYKSQPNNLPRPGHGSGRGVVYNAAAPVMNSWSNNNSSNSNSTVVNSTSNGKGCHSNSNGGNNICNNSNNSNQNGMGILQTGGMISNIVSNPTNKVKKVEDSNGGFMGRHPMPTTLPQHQHHHLLQNQHQLLHQFAHPAGAHHHQFYQLDNLPIPGQFPGYSFNGQAMENNL